ncbi:hypothetical protein D3C72_1023800 [compost metagenome]
MGRVSRQIGTWTIHSEQRVRAQIGQRRFTGLDLVRVDQVGALPYGQAHFRADLAGRGEVAARRYQVIRITLGVVPKQLRAHVVDLDLVALTARLVERFALLTRLLVQPGQLRHQQTEHCLGACDQGEGNREGVRAFRLTVDLYAVFCGDQRVQPLARQKPFVVHVQAYRQLIQWRAF